MEDAVNGEQGAWFLMKIRRQPRRGCSGVGGQIQQYEEREEEGKAPRKTSAVRRSKAIWQRAALASKDQPAILSMSFQGMLPIHYAAAYGQVQALKLLLEHGAGVNCLDELGRTPLHHAVAMSPDAVRLLIDSGADVNEGRQSTSHRPDAPRCPQELGFPPVEPWGRGMEKKLKKAVHEEFAAALQSAWPQFEKVSGACTGAARARGWQVFCWHANQHVWFFLTLIVDLRNVFGFRFMWSDQPDYPADDTGYPFFQNDPAQMPGSHQLFTKQRGGGLLAKEWMVGVNPAFVPAAVIPAAVAELKKALDPIMKKVLKHHGKWPKGQPASGPARSELGYAYALDRNYRRR